MASEPSDRAADGMLAAIKIVIAGGFGAGKTTLVGAVSEVQPLHTEEALSSGSIGLDDVSGVEGKTTTTVAMDFGRITISDRLVLYLFGTPGQERFWFMWDELSYGALGAVVLADTRRLDDCFPSVDYFEKCQLPFVIGINCFSDSPQYDPEDVRVALDLGPQVPVMLCDARQPASVKEVLIALVEHALVVSSAAASRPSNGQPPVSEPFMAGPQPVPLSDSHPQPRPPSGPPQPAALAEPHPQAYAGPPAPPPVSLPPAPPPVSLPPAPYGPPVAGSAPPLETPAAPGRAEPAGTPEPPPDAEVPADHGKTGWRPPLSRWRAAP